jgi:hypothetical protein
MNTLSSIGTIVAGIMAVVTTVVSWKALRDHSTLNNPIISVCVGALAFIGLRHLPEGLGNAILLLYVILAIAILFLLLWMGFQKVRQYRSHGDLSQKIEKQIRRPRDDQSSLKKQTDLRKE